MMPLHHLRDGNIVQFQGDVTVIVGNWMKCILPNHKPGFRVERGDGPLDPKYRVGMATTRRQATTIAFEERP